MRLGTVDEVVYKTQPQKLLLAAAVAVMMLSLPSSNSSAWDKVESRLPWHYVDFPFKPEGKPASIQVVQPPQENILTAIAENTRILRTASDPARRGVVLTWLFHLVGDVHQPLHAVQLFTREHPNGDRGGIEMCVRASLNGAPIELHRLWDGVITLSGNVSRIGQ